MERRIYLAAAVIGAAVLLIVAAGVVLTVILPPRAKVVTVGSRTFTAAELAMRAKYAVIQEGNEAAVSDPATVIPAMVREEVLRQKAGELGVSVSDDDLKAELRKRLGLAPEKSEEEFQAAYDRLIERLPISRSDYEEIVRTSLMGTKAIESFKAKVPEKGPQIHLLGATSPDRQKLEDLRTAVAAGKDFKTEAAARGLVKEAAQADLQWFDPASLPERIRPVRDLAAGQLSEVFMDDPTAGYFLAMVAERVDDQPYDESVKSQIANRLYQDWAKEQEAALVGPSSLSGNAKTWVEKQVKDALADAQRRSQAERVK